MKLLLLLAALLPLPALASDWRPSDTARELIYDAATIADWGQTRDIVDRPDHYSEINPMLGPHPSKTRVNNYFVATLASHALISYVLPVKYRSIYQYVSIGFEAGFVSSNISIGLHISF